MLKMAVVGYGWSLRRGERSARAFARKAGDGGEMARTGNEWHKFAFPFEIFETVTLLLEYATLDAQISFCCVVAFPKVLVETIASRMIRFTN
jgi:hypothetical protein